MLSERGKRYFFVNFTAATRYRSLNNKCDKIYTARFRNNAVKTQRFIIFSVIFCLPFIPHITVVTRQGTGSCGYDAGTVIKEAFV